MRVLRASGLVSRAPAQIMFALEHVEVAYKQSVQRAGTSQRILQQHSVGMATPEDTLPFVGSIIIVRRHRTVSVSSKVGPQNTKVLDPAVVHRLSHHCLHRFRVNAAPACMGMEFAPFVQQHALGAVEQYRAWKPKALRTKHQDPLYLFIVLVGLSAFAGGAFFRLTGTIFSPGSKESSVST